MLDSKTVDIPKLTTELQKRVDPTGKSKRRRCVQVKVANGDTFFELFIVLIKLKYITGRNRNMAIRVSVEV